jgi:hypothetical protein
MPRHFRIHPAIGAARMGNSPEHFVGPETPGLPAKSPDGVNFGSFRDAKGQILRQGARFRVFEYTENANGTLSNPGEVAIGADVVEIEWRVHLANRKASFYSFYGQVGAEDNYVTRSALPADKPIKPDDDLPQRTNLRNANVPPADRKVKLEIDPGEKTISTRQSDPLEISNQNPNIPIKSLGTLITEPGGRLIVLGGYGESNSTAPAPRNGEPETPPLQITEYANNDTWFDDASDGSVKARVKLSDGNSFDADPAWVIVGPPDFAPGIGNVVRLLDTIWDTAVREVDFGRFPPATPVCAQLAAQKKAWQASGNTSLAGFKPSFASDIFPLLKRAIGARDVHQSGTTENPHYHQRLLIKFASMSALSGPNAAEGEMLRKGIFDLMRNIDDPDPSPKWDKMPRGLGDFYTSLYQNYPNGSPKGFLCLTRIQYAMLREWANGNFIDDWKGAEPTFTANPTPTPDDLDISAIENCVGGPFYPGIDLSWLIRSKELFSEPLRFKTSPLPEAEAATAAPITVGALNFQSGFFSQQMALPWQADFYDCHKEDWDDPGGKQYFFMWWTAHRPDDVFPSGKNKQEPWVRSFYDEGQDIADFEENDVRRFQRMQTQWFTLKFVSVWNGKNYEEEP